MGGPGSGSWTRWSKKTTTDECRTLDVRRWRREGLLQPGYTGRWVWSRDGREVASIGYSVIGNADTGQAQAVELNYTATANGQQPEDIRYRTPLGWTSCHYGGTRPWFLCPGIVRGQHCNRRVALLYQQNRYFVRRYCNGLSYESQGEGADGRARIQLQALRVQLGGSPNLSTGFPWKPKHMHWRTYWRLREQAQNLELRYYAGLALWLQRTDARIEGMTTLAKDEKPQRRR